MGFFIWVACALKGHKRSQERKEGEMIEKLVNSKTRIKILKLFLSHIDDRYYLRELERMLEESLSPLRRQLVKLTRMGILVVEEEENLKYRLFCLK